MPTSTGIRQELLKKYPMRTIYNKIRAIKKIAGNSISTEVAIDVLASQHDLDVHTILKKENRLDEITQFRDAMSKFDFDAGVPRKKYLDNSKLLKKEERSPYDFPLSRFNLDQELTTDCKLVPPFRIAVSESLLILEIRIRNTLHLPNEYIGIKLIEEAQRIGIFKRNVASEEQGLYMLFRGAIQGLRNPAGHRKINYTKEDSLKIVLFADYLIKLFEELVANVHLPVKTMSK